MALKLLSYRKFPPDGFYYDDPSGRYFQAEGGIRQLTTRVSDYRSGNNYERKSWEECFEDIEQFTVARLNGDPAWVTDTEVYVPERKVRNTGGCCGAKV